MITLVRQYLDLCTSAPSWLDFWCLT